MTTQAAEAQAHPPTTAAVRFLAILAGAAAAYWAAPILVPFLLGLVLAIALAPVAGRLERWGVGRTISSLICMILVGLVIAGVATMLSYQIGQMVQRGDRYLDRLGDTAARVIRSAGGEPWLRSITRERGEKKGSEARTDEESVDREGDALVRQVRATLRQNADRLGEWAASGVNGLLGVLGNTVVVLAFLFYMLQDRDAWIDRLKRAADGLGLDPRDRDFQRVGHQVRHYLTALLLVSGSYALVLTPILWLIGVPQPLFWGFLTAVLELVPFFGPVVAGILTTLAALGAGGAWWQPLAVIAAFLVLGMVEGYVVTPLLYGKAVAIDPVTVLLGVMVAGFLLGPAGLALAMSMMILLRGVLIVSPDTPALDAVAGVDETPETAKAVPSA